MNHEIILSCPEVVGSSSGASLEPWQELLVQVVWERQAGWGGLGPTPTGSWGAAGSLGMKSFVSLCVWLMLMAAGVF